MADLKAEAHYVHLGSGLYLDPKGKLVGSLPANATISRLPYELNLPDSVKGTVQGLDLAALPGVIGSLSPVFEEFGVSKKTVEVVGACISLAIGLVSVVGTVGAAVNLLKVLGVFGGADDSGVLRGIAEKVAEIKRLQIELGQQAAVDKIAPLFGSARGARLNLLSAARKQRLTEDDYRALRSEHFDLVKDFETLFATDDFQRYPYDMGRFATRPESQPWWQHVQYLESRDQCPPAGRRCPPPLASLNGLPPTGNRWDYTIYLPPILELTSIILSYQRLIDPAFRTSGQFSDTLATMARHLDELAADMASRVNWTRDYDPFMDHAYPPADGWPVGAVDGCSGAASYDPAWQEGAIFAPEPQRDPFGRRIVLNVDDLVARARPVRELAWLTVYAAIGGTQVMALAKTCRELSTLPETSETVRLTSNRAFDRRRLGPGSHSSSPALACPVQSFPAEVFAVRRTVTIAGQLQPADQATYYAIPYRFFLDSYQAPYDWPSVPDADPAHRVELPLGQGIPLTVEVCTFDWEVRPPQGRRPPGNEVVGPWRRRLPGLDGAGVPLGRSLLRSAPGRVAGERVTTLSAPKTRELLGFEGRPTSLRWTRAELICSFERADGRFTATVDTPPGGEINLAGLVLTVEEQPNQADARPLRTHVDLSTVGLELHLPQEWFDYVDGCRRRQNDIKDEIDRKRIPRRAVGPRVGPEFDPNTYASPRDWLEDLVRQHPDQFSVNELQRFRQALPAGPW